MAYMQYPEDEYMATIKDIAEEVGISKAAVSRILNHKGSFSPETIAKVERAARRLNYTPTSVLQQEAAECSKIVAAIFPTAEFPYYGYFSALLESELYNYGYNLMLCSSLFDREKEEACYKYLREKKICGVFLGSYTYDETMIGEQDFPVVTIGYKLSDSIPAVRTDNFLIGRIAAKHLLSKGCKKLLYITGYPGGLEMDLRYQGFREELKFRECSVWTYEINMDMQLRNNYSDVISQMILEHPDADGVFAETDALALNCIQIYSGLGYRIPEDIKIIAYGNIQFSMFSNPQLTIVQENTKEIVRRAAALMIDLIESEKKEDTGPAEEIIVPVALNERKTT